MVATFRRHRVLNLSEAGPKFSGKADLENLSKFLEGESFERVHLLHDFNNLARLFPRANLDHR